MLRLTNWITYRTQKMSKKRYTKDVMLSNVWSLWKNGHCVTRVQMRSFFWSVFSRNRNEYGEISGWSSVDEVGQAGVFSFFSLLRLTQKALQLPFSFFSRSFLLTEVLPNILWLRQSILWTHQNVIFVKILPQVVIRDTCGIWHGLCTVTSIHSIQKKHKKQEETSETSQLASRW